MSSKKTHKLFVCSDSELLSFLSTFSSKKIGKNTLELLIQFEEKFQENELYPFCPFLRVPTTNGESSWMFLPEYFFTFLSEVWDNFTELILKDTRQKGDIFESELRQIFTNAGFNVWKKHKIQNLMNYIKRDGTGDIDLIIQDESTVLWIQAKSVYYNRKSYQTVLRKGRKQLVSAYETFRRNQKTFSY
ncbi:hypothetical protein CEE45_04815 [Candidatus Heimdallarchaeota archaeon B3_Heim]|nr:MAG: hypothetical protein CEE45_04815 [Candidatus Heimdallarchaeota archaeon B3_Heim]